MTHLKRLWCWERLKTWGEGDDRRWDGWVASLTWWTWAWVGSRSWCWTGKPGVLQFVALQTVRHDWTTELNWTEMKWIWFLSELNLSIPGHFILLIPKMSMFTLAISSSTTSNLSWLTDLTFQVSMHYCSLQHWTWLPSPVPSTIGHFFHFGSISSFFLELFLHSSPVPHWTPTNLGSSSFSVLSFCLPTVS